MAIDDDFKPKLGKPRARGGKVTTGKAYVNQVLKASNLARGGAAQSGGSKRSLSFDGSRIGRGSGVGRVLSSRAGGDVYRQRRVIVKSRIVKLGGKGLAGALAHMRYIQRDGVTREGLPGELYSRDMDRADGKAFMERADGDRHQFRFILSPEDGIQYDDLKSVTRRLMSQMEADLNTQLDWVAVDHHNTGNPHTHIIVRGKDDLGKDLIIAKEYITHGIRERATEIVSLDLGPKLDSEIDASLKAQVTQDRFTSLDAQLIRNRDEAGLVRAIDADSFRQSLLAGRLHKLEGLGLAEKAGPATWQLVDDLEPTLRRLGERGDIIKTMAHELKRKGLDHGLSEAIIHEPGTGEEQATQLTKAITGQVIKRGLSDELNDTHYLIVDGTDGRVHYVDIGQGDATVSTPTNAIVRLEAKVPTLRQADHTIAEVAAANGGQYSANAHLKHDRGAKLPFVETHIRRLEAIRRATGAVERSADGKFSIGPDYLKAALDYERQQVVSSPIKVEVLSSVPLDQQIRRQAATWLDKELTSVEPQEIASGGFGKAVQRALIQRQQWLIEEGLATDQGNGQVSYANGMVDTLNRREVRATGEQLSRDLGKPFRETRQGEYVEGTYRRAVELAGGKFALVEKSKEFTLVPWRQVLEKHIDKEVSGIMRESGINWTIGRDRGMDIG